MPDLTESLQIRAEDRASGASAGVARASGKLGGRPRVACEPGPVGPGAPEVQGSEGRPGQRRRVGGPGPGTDGEAGARARQGRESHQEAPSGVRGDPPQHPRPRRRPPPAAGDPALSAAGAAGRGHRNAPPRRCLARDVRRHRERERGDMQIRAGTGGRGPRRAGSHGPGRPRGHGDRRRSAAAGALKQSAFARRVWWQAGRRGSPPTSRRVVLGDRTK